MERPGSRPFRATVYLPGDLGDGRWIAARKVSAGTQEGLERVLDRYRADGYRVVAYEEVHLPLIERSEP